jgi:hypothetical protein
MQPVGTRGLKTPCSGFATRIAIENERLCLRGIAISRDESRSRRNHDERKRNAAQLIT